jgi:trigger factor
MTSTTQMKIDRTDLNPCTVLLKIECAPEQVSAALNKSLKRMSKRVRIPGFRPGTAPPEIVKKHVNMEAVKEWAAEEIVNAAVKEAIQQERLTPFRNARPIVNDLEYDADALACQFTVKIPLEPIVELGPYKGLKASVPPTEISEEMVDEYIEQLRTERATKQPVETRGAQNGDQAVVTIRPQEEGLEEKAFAVSVGQTFPSLDEALLGMKPEDVRTVDLTFPEDFTDPAWRGKTIRCEIEMRSLTAPVLPELDEEFAIQFNAESVAELRELIRTAIKRAMDRRNHDLIHEQLLKQVLENSRIELPDNLWEDVAEQRLQQLREDLSRAGKTLEEAAQEEGMSEEGVIEHFRQSAKNEVARALAIRHIAEAEGIQITREDVIQQAVEIAEQEGVQPEVVVEAYRRQNRIEELHFQALYKKVLSFLEENAEVETEVSG